MVIGSTRAHGATSAENRGHAAGDGLAKTMVASGRELQIRILVVDRKMLVSTKSYPASTSAHTAVMVAAPEKWCALETLVTFLAGQGVSFVGNVLSE